MTAPPLSPTEYARAHVQVLYADAPNLAREFADDCRKAHKLAAKRARKAAKVARHHRRVHKAARAAYRQLKAADAGGGT